MNDRVDREEIKSLIMEARMVGVPRHELERLLAGVMSKQMVGKLIGEGKREGKCEGKRKSG